MNLFVLCTTLCLFNESNAMTESVCLSVCLLLLRANPQNELPIGDSTVSEAKRRNKERTSVIL